MEWRPYTCLKMHLNRNTHDKLKKLMNKIAKIGIGIAMTMGANAMMAQQINPMTEAVLRNYAEILEENPKDYYTLYDRAAQYLELGEFARALSDVEMALEYTPVSDKDYRQAEYSLKGDILTAQKNYTEALEAFGQALSVNPSSQSDLYKTGNLFLLTGKYNEALKAFQALQRENTRSQDAFYGMAKANAMMSNREEAEKLISQIESLGKQSYLTYCRIGDLYSDMGEIKEAVTNYAIAFSMEDKSNRPVESTKLLASKNPAMVISVLDGIIASQPENLAPSYLKAIVAFDKGMYAQAEEACKSIKGNLEEESAAVFRMMGMAQLAQDKLADAKESIRNAERVAPNDGGVLIDKAEILMSQDPAASYEAAKRALGLDPTEESYLMTAAKTAMLTGNYPEAQTYLNEIVLSNPSNIEALLLRGYLNTEYLNDGKAGIADYTRASNYVQDGKVKNLVLAALGKAKTNKRLDADGMINEAIQKAGNDGESLYEIAVYYAQTDNLEKAKEYADKAMLNDFGNLYKLRTDNEPLFNLQPIRHLMGK